MTYNHARYLSIMKWRAKNREKSNALNNSYKIKYGTNKIYWDKFRYYSYDREAKRLCKILL